MAVVIEDDPDVGELIELILKQAGLRTVLVTDGEAGLEAVREHKPLLTTLDVNLPGADGFSVARRMRDFSDTYLIMVTGMVSEVDVIRGFEAGADDYLVKPFRPRELRARADAMMRRYRRWEAQGQAVSDGAVVASPPLVAEAPPSSWVTNARAELDQVSEQTVTEPRVPEQVVPEQVVADVPPAAPEPVTAPAPAPAPVTAAPAPAAAPVPVAAPVQPAGMGVTDIVGEIKRGAILAHPGHRTVSVEGRSVSFDPTHLDLLLSLMASGRQVRSKAELALTMRGEGTVVGRFVNEAEKRRVDAQITSLREKLGDSDTSPRYIETVRGVGYRMVHAD